MEPDKPLHLAKRESDKLGELLAALPSVRRSFHARLPPASFLIYGFDLREPPEDWKRYRDGVDEISYAALLVELFRLYHGPEFDDSVFSAALAVRWWGLGAASATLAEMIDACGSEVATRELVMAAGDHNVGEAEDMVVRALYRWWQKGGGVSKAAVYALQRIGTPAFCMALQWYRSQGMHRFTNTRWGMLKDEFEAELDELLDFVRDTIDDTTLGIAAKRLAWLENQEDRYVLAGGVDQRTSEAILLKLNRLKPRRLITRNPESA